MTTDNTILTPLALSRLLQAYGDEVIACVGDFSLDRYFEIDPEWSEPSVETNLTVRRVQRVRNYPGSAGTVWKGLASVGCRGAYPVTVIGNDGHGHDLQQSMQRYLGEHCELFRAGIILDPERPTFTYAKRMQLRDAKWVETERLDTFSTDPIGAKSRAALRKAFADLFPRCKAVIVSDQIATPEVGIWDEEMVQLLFALERQYPNVLVYVDSRARIGKFTAHDKPNHPIWGSGVLKPNHVECQRAVGVAESDSPDAVCNAASLLARRTGRTIICTHGENGAWLAKPEGEPLLVPSFRLPPGTPTDICGAGDNFTSLVVPSLLVGANLTTAISAGHLAACVSIQELGVTGEATPDKLKAAINSFGS
jgi:bifunctional ADP-heptose synthase (sugar kinase/adenylyltransferase)